MKNKNEEILMTIFSDQQNTSNDPNKAMIVLLQGFHFKQVRLFQMNDVDVQVKKILDQFIHKKTYINFNKLDESLKKGEVSKCPLHMIKQLAFLYDNEKLIIRKYDRKSGLLSFVNLSSDVTQKILKYLFTNDLSSQKTCCLKFFLEVFIPKISEHSDRLGNDVDILDEIEIVHDETALAVGDWVVLFSKKVGEYGVILTFEHYALFLEKELLSQLGNGNPLMIMSMESLQQAYNCTGFARIKPDAHLEVFNRKGLGTFSVGSEQFKSISHNTFK